MTREFAEELPMIELAEMLISWSEDYQDDEATDIVDDFDRYDLLEELEGLGAFDIPFDIGDEVEVPDPNEDDLHNHGFVGFIIAFKGDNALVQDGDACVFEIELDRLTLA